MNSEIKLKKICIPNYITVKELANKMNLNPSKIVQRLFMHGKVETVNSTINYETAKCIADEYGLICEKKMKRYIVEVSRRGYREVEADDCGGAEETAYDLNTCDGVVWSDFVDVVRVEEKDYRDKRWGDLSPEDRKFLLSEYSLTDIDDANGGFKEFTDNGRCIIDLNAECCCITGIVDDGEIFINDDAVIFAVG